MNIEHLIKKCEKASLLKNKKDREQLLIKAGILDKNGDYDRKYFSQIDKEDIKIDVSGL